MRQSICDEGAIKCERLVRCQGRAEAALDLTELGCSSEDSDKLASCRQSETGELEFDVVVVRD